MLEAEPSSNLSDRRGGTEPVTVTKRDLVLRVTEKTGIPQADVARIVEAMFATLSSALEQGLRWELRDFGVFEVKTRASRMGRNPRTGDQVPVPKRRVVTFRPGKLMKQLIAGNAANVSDEGKDRPEDIIPPSSPLSNVSEPPQELG